MPLSDFTELFKADIIFQESPLYSSTFHACANLNPVKNTCLLTE